MKTPLYLPAMAMLMIVRISSIVAVPTQSIDLNKSRQLVMNSDVPTAATGLNNGNPTGLQTNPLQTLNTINQVTKSGNSPTAMAAELEAQQQEAHRMQNQNHQQSLLAAVQTKQDQVNTVQAAISNQSHMSNGQKRPGVIPLTSLHPNAQQLQQQLEVEKQQLLLQQQFLKQQVKPEAQQMTPQQILLTQLLREPVSKRPQLLEQIKQTQTKQQAEILINPTPTLPATQSTRAQQHEIEKYKTLTQPVGYHVDPTSVILSMTGSPIMGHDSILAAQLHQVNQANLLQRQQLQQILMFQHQLAMANPLLSPMF